MHVELISQKSHAQVLIIPGFVLAINTLINKINTTNAQFAFMHAVAKIIMRSHLNQRTLYMFVMIT